MNHQRKSGPKIGELSNIYRLVGSTLFQLDREGVSETRVSKVYTGKREHGSVGFFATICDFWSQIPANFRHSKRAQKNELSGADRL